MRSKFGECKTSGFTVMTVIHYFWSRKSKDFYHHEWKWESLSPLTSGLYVSLYLGRIESKNVYVLCRRCLLHFNIHLRIIFPESWEVGMDFSLMWRQQTIINHLKWTPNWFLLSFITLLVTLKLNFWMNLSPLTPKKPCNVQFCSFPFPIYCSKNKYD